MKSNPIQKFVLCGLIFLGHFIFCVNAFSQNAVVSMNRFATETGEQILKKGGNAADAAVAMSLVLSVTEPHHAGLGSGGLMLYFDQEQGQVSYLDFLPMAPFKSNEVKWGTTDQSEFSSTSGWYSIGVPGLVRGLNQFHERFGQKKWKDLFDQAIVFAEDGFIPSEEFRDELSKNKKRLAQFPQSKLIFVEALNSKKDLLIQNNLATTLVHLRDEGAATFYEGNLSKKILKDLKSNEWFTEEDFQTYQAYFRKPLKFFLRDRIVYTAGAPSWGGAFLESLLQSALRQKITNEPQKFYLHLQEQVGRFFHSKSELLDTKENILGNTTHFIVRDIKGNIACVTLTQGRSFGSAVVLDSTGILMNNVMQSFVRPKADAAGQIKRKRRGQSWLAPTIVMKGFGPEVVIGTTGGQTIPQNLFQILYPTLFFEESLSTVLKKPKVYFSHENSMILVEPGFSKKSLPKSLWKSVNETQSNMGNTQALWFQGRSIRAINDSRGVGVGHVFH